jgi:hypothetical protein
MKALLESGKAVVYTLNPDLLKHKSYEDYVYKTWKIIDEKMKRRAARSEFTEGEIKIKSKLKNEFKKLFPNG